MKPTLSTLVLALFCVGCQAEKEKAVVPASEPEVQYVDAAQAAALLKSETLTVIDVRTPAEFDAGHVEGALNIDFKGTGFAEQLANLDPGITYLVHCASGGRSTAALEVFEAAGLKRIYHLDGGYNGWKEAGLDSVP